MPNQETREIQNFGKERLERRFPRRINEFEIRIQKEWYPFPRRRFHNISSPIIDIAVGPFALERRHIQEYDSLMKARDVSILIKSLIYSHEENINLIQRDYPGIENRVDLQANSNARCFLAIEIEGRKDRKVVLADIVNVAAMGRVGLIVAKTTDVLNIFIKLLYYSMYLSEVRKPSFITSNVLIITKEQFFETLSR